MPRKQTRPRPGTALEDAREGLRQELGVRPIATQLVGPGALEIKVVRETTVGSEHAARMAEMRAHNERDVVERLKELRAHPYRDTYHIDIIAAIDEIEWLRASRPESVVTRQELEAITEQVRSMHAALEALLDRLEAKEGKR